MPDTAPNQYVRLPGSGIARKGASFISVSRTTSRLWLGDDHLLQVESVGGYSESYKRFYFRDIQAISMHKTKTWLAWNSVLGFLAGIFLLWALLVKEVGGIIALAIIAAAFGGCLLLNVWRGPTCRCQLRTAVHLEELPSLGRRRNAEKFLARVKPLVEAAQGGADAETLASQYAALLVAASAAPAAPGQFVRMADPTVTAYRSRAHQILFFILLADAITDVLNIFLPGVLVISLGMLTGAALSVAVLVALVKQNQTDLKTSLRVLTWISAVFVGLGYLVGYIIMFAVAPSHRSDGTQWGFIKALAELQPFETPWWLAVLSVSGALAGVLGLTGLLLLGRQERERPAA